MIIKVGPEIAGKNLREIGQTFGFRGDLVASANSMDDGIPLKEGQIIDLSSFDPNSSEGMGGWVRRAPGFMTESDLIIDTVVESLPEPPKLSDNPFAFDEELAREAATAEFSPFYKEKLEDFLGDVEIRRQRGAAEEGRLLEDLTEERDEELVARGLLFSGERARDVTGEEPGSTSPLKFMRDLLRRGRDVTVGTKELFEDLTRTAFRGERAVGREEEAAIEGGVLKRRGEELESFLGGLETQEEGVTFAQPLGVLGRIGV